MVDASIIIAIISLVSSLAAACFTGWNSLYIERVKRRAENRALMNFKYRDPLILAAMDLQSRIYGIVQGGLLRFHDDEEKKDLVYVYTSFLFGQYFAWTFILRRQAQFLRFSTENPELSRLLETITNEIAVDSHSGEQPFMLWRGQQMAMGELMMEKEGDEYYCLGYSTFFDKYHSDPKFRNWFVPIERGILELVEARTRNESTPAYRLRRLQHRLVDLMAFLDPEVAGAGRDQRLKCPAAEMCRCANCPGMPIQNRGMKAQV